MGHCGRAGPTPLKLPARALPVVALLAYLAASVLLGALLAFPVYVALEQRADPAFDSVLHRVAALTLLVLLPLYLASGRAAQHGRSLDRASRATAALGRRSARSSRAPVRRVVAPSPIAEAIGLDCSGRTFRRAFGGGFVLGILVVSPLVAAFLVLGVRAPVQTIGTAADVGAHLAYALAAATIIGVIEEAYFRGALLAPLHDLPAWLAVSIISVVYAVVHFLGAPLPAEETRSWTSGVVSIAFSEIPLDGFLALIAAGLFLGALRCRFGHIAFGAGVQPGWVWIMQLNREYTDIVPGSEWRFLEGAYGGTMGYLGLAWILLLGGAWLVWACSSPRKLPHSSPHRSSGSRAARARPTAAHQKH